MRGPSKMPARTWLTAVPVVLAVAAAAATTTAPFTASQTTILKVPLGRSNESLELRAHERGLRASIEYGRSERKGGQLLVVMYCSRG